MHIAFHHTRTHTHTQNLNLAHMVIGIVILAMQAVNVSLVIYTGIIEPVQTLYVLSLSRSLS